MNIEKEQKIFYSILWLFLIGSLIFFIVFLSLGRISLPKSVWVMMLLLNVGFIIFIFIPHPRGIFSRHGGDAGSEGQYPRTFADIMGSQEGGEGGEELRPPVKAIPPVPLVPLLLLFVIVLLAAPAQPDQEKWWEGEVDRMTEVYQKTKGEVERLESLMGGLGEEVREIVEPLDLGAMASDTRARVIHRIDSIAGSFHAGSALFSEIGIQVSAPDGRLVAWGGRPRYLGSARGGGSEVKVYTGKTSLYTLKIREIPLANGGMVVIDIPLEVNYQISNRFLRSMSLGETLSERYGEDVGFNFAIGEHRGEMRWEDENLKKSDPQVTSTPDGGAMIYGIVSSTMGLPLARLVVRGEPISVSYREREERRVFWAGLILTLAVVVISVWTYRTYCKRRGEEPAARFRNMLRRLLVLLAFIFLIRYLLRNLDLPNTLFGTNLFDPALFAYDFPGGLMSTVGDFLVTAIFALMVVFGCIKVFRTYYHGYLERSLSGGKPFRWTTFLVRAICLLFFISGLLILAVNVVSRVVWYSNPRLIGVDVRFFDLPVLSLHLSLLFLVSAIFIAALFASRLIMVWKEGGIREVGAAAAVALAGILFFFGFDWALLLAALGLLLLSIKIFPFLNVKDVTSIIFSSFFLVIICSLVVYGTASKRYTELWKSCVLEKAQDFIYPDDNWIQFVLPDICQDISNDRRVAPKVVTRRESVAFEIWARSLLSRSNLSCIFDVYDAMGRHFSRFTVGVPFEPPPVSPDTSGNAEAPVVEKMIQETKSGVVSYFRGTTLLYHSSGRRIGRVEITIPYFFENPELLARTGPMVPEVLQNIEPGALARRVDEPEDLLVARVSRDRVVDSSSPLLFAGTVLPAMGEEWFNLGLGKERYNCVVRRREDSEGFLVGYRTAGFLESLLHWATIVSLDVILTVVSLFVLIIVRRFPVVGSVMPAISITGGLEFRQKILLSFLVVSILPVVILGAFSSQFVQRRFRLEGEQEALARVRSATSLINHSIRAEAESFSGSQYMSDILRGKTDARIRDVALFEKTQFTLFDRTGTILLDESLSDFDAEEVKQLLHTKNRGMVIVSFDYPNLYGGVVIPVALPEGPSGYLYYRRRLDDEFIKGISDVLDEDVNIYYRGLVRASSERGFFIGGFLNPLLHPAVFADIALNRSKAVVMEESLGDYSYHVASAPLNAFLDTESAVLSVPMMYQPVLVQKEVLRTSALILGLLALLFAATVTLGTFLAGKIFTPIAALRGGTRRIIEGDLEFKLEAEAPDVIGELVDSFNTMTAALREARRNLLERQRYLTAVLDNVATGVIASDSEGRIITLNPSGEKILRTSRGEVLGKKLGELEDKGLAPLLELFSEGERPIRERELTLFTGDERRTIKAVVTSLAESGERLGTVIVFDDLTELIHSKKLAAWVEMARQIAHEVKNPLTPIRLSAQLMQRAYDAKAKDFDEIFTSGVNTVIQQTEILRRIATEFSSFGQVAGLSLSVISLNDFVSEFISLYRGAEGVEIVHEVGGDLTVYADTEALRKILVNLMENALEAMPEGGTVTVRTARAGECARIIVTDTGHGLSPEVQEKLFEPYLSTKTNGTGLGLAISQSLVREMDGEIAVRNREEGRGVEATVTLPLAE